MIQMYRQRQATQSHMRKPVIDHGKLSLTQLSQEPPIKNDSSISTVTQPFQSLQVESPSISPPTPNAHEQPTEPPGSSYLNTIKQHLHKIDFPDNTSFYGRSDILTELEVLMTKGLGTEYDCRSFAIFGAPGTGKTQTALKFAYTHSKEYRYIFWVSSETKSKLVQSFAEYAGLLGLVSGNTQRDPTSDAEALKKWFEEIGMPGDCPDL
jgi:hypothetical protein